jgi:hypothetical protein
VDGLGDPAALFEDHLGDDSAASCLISLDKCRYDSIAGPRYSQSRTTCIVSFAISRAIYQRHYSLLELFYTKKRSTQAIVIEE